MLYIKMFFFNKDDRTGYGICTQGEEVINHFVSTLVNFDIILDLISKFLKLIITLKLNIIKYIGGGKIKNSQECHYSGQSIFS